MELQNIVSSLNLSIQLAVTASKVSKYGVFSGPNTGKYRPGKTSYLDASQAMSQNQNSSYLAKLLLLVK